MNPYGTRWRCKGKNLPAPEKGHVTPPLLRLDSTGEITSESGSTDRYDMGTLIDSTYMKIQKRIEPMTKRSFMDCKSAPNVLSMDSDFLLNQLKQQTMNPYSNTSPYSAPHWGYYKKTPARPNSCAFSNYRNSANMNNPEFKNFHHQKAGLHPAVTGHHLGQRYPNKASSHRCQHPDAIRSSRRPRHSFPSEKVPSDCTNWRKMPKEHSLQDDCPIHKDRIESTTTAFRRSDTASQTLLHSKNVNDHKKETLKPVIDTKSAMPSQEKSNETSHIEVGKPDHSRVAATTDKENDKGSNGQKSASVQFFDWFECGQSEENSGSDIPPRIGFRVRTLSVDSESSNDPSVVNNKTLQREASVLSDIFQPDDTVIHVTCMFKENDSMAADKECGNSTESQSNEYPPSQKDDYCDSIADESNELEQNKKCAEKKSEPSDLDKDCARRIVLLVRNNNKKGCRPSAKKRRRSKARKEDPSEISSSHLENHAQKSQFQERKCKETNSQKSSTNKKLGSTNTVAFVLGIDSNTSASNPLKQHSFLVSFDSESDDFSEDSGDDFSDSDGADELDFFSCPLQLNVICPVNKPDACASTQQPSPSKSCDESEERQKEILDVNLKWRKNFPISPQEKSKTKVTFANEDKLCTVYDLEEEDRKGHWEEFVRDRERFQRRIAEVEEVLKPVLSTETRDRIYDKYFKTELKRDQNVDDH